jgi:hypothetical protein
MVPDVVVALNRRRLPLLDATGGLPSVASTVGPASAELGPASLFGQRLYMCPLWLHALQRYILVRSSDSSISLRIRRV